MTLRSYGHKDKVNLTITIAESTLSSPVIDIGVEFRGIG